MKIVYETTVLGFGNHASLEIPQDVLMKFGGKRRLPLKVTVNGHTYQSTSTGMDGKCLVVFPTRDREASGTKAGDLVRVMLELDEGYRSVDMPDELIQALTNNALNHRFKRLTYSKRREFSRQVADAKTDQTRKKRIEKIIAEIKES